MMKKIPIAAVLLLFITVTTAIDQALEDEEINAIEYMTELNVELARRRNIETVASWAYASNITDENEKLKNDVSAENAKFYKEKFKELRTYNYRSYQDEDLQRQFKQLSKLGYAALPDEKLRELLAAVSAMESNYAKVRVCDFSDKTKCDLQLEPEITAVLEKSTNEEELKYFWLEWYNKAGTPTRADFDKYVALNKEAALLNNFTSGAESWLDDYEDDTFEQQLENIFDQIRPLYEQLHAYVRNKLRHQYGDIVPKDGPIPMHILGNMWGQSWENIAAITAPFPSKVLLDVTGEMVKQNYTAIKIFQMGDEFFQSLNMTKLPQTFWDKSILEKPTDGRDLICHASAWDFYVKDDVRIKQCTRITMDHLFTAHHELGHIQYYLQYQNQPTIYREGANPGFHEAVGDVLGLSVSTPKHLQKIGLLKDYVFDDAAKINQLYRDALEKIIFLPFAFTLDKYRWGIFRGEIKPNEYNCRFWKLRESYSGIVPPVQRTEKDFDATAKYHVSADVEYLRYLVSFIIQFQFHKAACEIAGEYVPGDAEKILSNCDIYQSTNAGNAFKAMLSMGSSKPWPDAMEVLTGTRKMEAAAILEYFKPLEEWLINANKESGAYVGWNKTYQCG